MIFNRNNLKKFTNKITEDSYLNLTNADAFVWLHSQQEELNYEIEQLPVEDEIYFYQEIDLLNSSPTEKMKFFIEKNNESRSNIKLFFYDNFGENRIKLTVGNTEQEYIVNDFDIIDLGYNEEKIQVTKLEIDSEIFDLTDIIKKIKHNVIILD